MGGTNMSPEGRPDPSPVPTLSELLDVAVEAAHAGGRRTLEYFGGRVPSETKGDGSPVTPADRASEREIRRVIQKAYPGHAILGEEGGSTPGDPHVRWILDPIDGTKTFVHGVPLYAVLVAVEIDGRPSVGVIHLPALHETVAAASGLGCRWNGRPASVSPVERLSEATVLMTSVRGLEARGVRFERLSSATKLQRGWGDAYGYALVATGRVDAMIDAAVQVWDVAPLLPILEEAGGRFTDWHGHRGIASGDAVGSNGRIHDPLLRVLAER
jgi:histidinol phosphatase-like enzyme (inositol monophosphatase family)